MFDTLIRGGTVIDGTGRPAFAADVAISSGRIAAIGDLSAASAAHVIDAAGRTVTPGFIDIHRHADAALFRPGFGAAELCQGLTTIVNGNCGLSAAPFGPAHGDAIRDYLRPITGALPPELVTDTLAGYFASVPNIPVHVGMLAGAWRTATTAPCTAPWSGLWPTARWASLWAWVTPRSASIPRRS